MADRGEGMNRDDLQSNDSRLKYKWRWSRIAAQIPEEEIKKWRRFQCSYARLNDWQMEAIQRPGYYEAQINYKGNRISEQNGFKTRIAAQIGAEKLLKIWIRKQVQIIRGVWTGKGGE